MSMARKKPVKGVAGRVLAIGLIAALAVVGRPLPVWGESESSVSRGEAWDSERAFIELERLRAEIRLLRGLGQAQAALLAWNRERAEGAAGPAVLAAELCVDPAVKPWCRALPATFGEAAEADDEQAEEVQP